MRRGSFLATAFFLMAVMAILNIGTSCDDDDDDNDSGDDGDDDNDTADDDTGDDDTVADDDDDDTPTGPAPLIDNLQLIPEEGFAGDTISMSFHFLDNEGDIDGGTISLSIDGDPMANIDVNTAGTTSGFVDFIYTLPTELDTGVVSIQVVLNDVAGNASNQLSADLDFYGENVAPAISNLRFDPDPACLSLTDYFTIIFDFLDPNANLNGGTVSIIIDGMFPPLVGTLTGAIPASGTVGLDLNAGTFTNDLREGEPVNFVIQLADNRGLASNVLSANLVFTIDACDKR